MKKLFLYGGIPTVLISILGFIVISSKTITIYAEMPEKVQKIEVYIEAQQRANEVQAKANELMQKIVTKDEEEVVVSDDGKKYWDKKLKQWRPIKELKKDGD